MARRRSGARQRDASHITSHYHSTLLSQPVRISSALSHVRALQAQKSHQRSLLEDRRRFHPLGVFAPPAAKNRPSRRIVASRHPFGRHVLKFNVPRNVYLCARRKIRKEVLHALRLTGKGSAQKKRRRNEYSDISCK